MKMSRKTKIIAGILLLFLSLTLAVTYRAVYYGINDFFTFGSKKSCQASKCEKVTENVPVVNQSSEEPVYSTAEKMPEFPGGQTAMTKFIAENIKYPKEAKEKGIKGTVFINFIIDKEGNVTHSKVLKGIGGGCDEEALRVINMMPKWTPGEQVGKKVLVKINVPIRFVLR